MSDPRKDPDPRPRPARWSVYLLRCADGSLYCGITNDLERRLRAHNKGGVKYTRGRLPVALAHVEAAADRGGALRREAAVKRLSRAQKLRLVSTTETGVPLSVACTAPPNTLSPKDVQNFAYLPIRRRRRRGVR